MAVSSDVKPEQVGHLIKDAESRKLLLPNYQRDFVWKMEDQKSLATSLLLDVPLGSLLLLSGSTADYSSRQIGTRIAAEFTHDTDCKYVLDGQQRLSSLYSLIADPYEGSQWASRVQTSYYNLRYRWALRIYPDPKEDEVDIFGVEHLVLNQPLPAEPDAIQPRVVPLRVKMNPATNDWHHPGWKEDLSENRRVLEIVNAAAHARMVPLWRITAETDRPDSLHRRVLQKIARDRAETLDARIADGDVSPQLREALKQVRPDLDETAGPDEWRDALADLRANWVADMTHLLSAMTTFKLPVVELPTAQIDKAIVIFELMNRGGMPLSTFDLLTAKLAKTAGNQNLGALISERISTCEIPITEQLWGKLPGPRIDSWSPKGDAVALVKESASTVFKNSFLWTLSLLANLSEGHELTTGLTKETQILALKPAQVQSFWEPATDALLRAWAFLQIRCGVRSEGDLRNKLLVIPAALALRADDALENKKLLDRLEYWYWCSVLTSTYTARQNDNAIQDSNKLLSWAATGSASENPFSSRREDALKEKGYSDEDCLLRKTEDAGVATDVGMYLLQYELARAPYDILSSTKRLYAWVDGTQDHHLVPLGSAKTVFELTREIRGSNEGIARLLNSPLNRSLISVEANKKIGAMDLPKYLVSVPVEARVSRGLPSLEALAIDETEGNKSAAEADVVKIMKQRYQWFLDKLSESLDSLVY